jgi:hypothetical protein
LLLLLSTSAFAAEVKRLPDRSPPPVTESLRAQLIADEDLDPDALRALARPGVSLWLRTRSNTLRDSTLETARQFEHAWIELSPPLDGKTLAQLSRAPAAGIWLRPKGGAALPALRPGPLRLAISLEGPLDEARAEAVVKLSPAVVEWKTNARQADLLSWSLFKNLPGKLLFRPDTDAVAPVDCARPGRQDVAVAVHVALLLSLGKDAFPCGKGARIRVTAETEPWVVQSLHVGDPSKEIELDVGADLARVRKARQLFDALGLVPRPSK